MAKIIHTPNVTLTSRIKLPLERAVQTATVETDADENRLNILDPPAGDTASRTVQVEQQLRSERDAAIGKATELERRLNEIDERLGELQKTASEQGYLAGIEQASIEGAARLEEEAHGLRDVLSSLEQQQTELIRQSEEAAVEIGIAAAFKLLGRTAVDQSLLGSLIQQSLKQVLSREGLVIYLTPTDCERMRVNADKNGAEWAEVQFEPDSRIELGGCRIESKAGTLDARLERQIAELKRVLLTAGKRRKQESQ